MIGNKTNPVDFYRKIVVVLVISCVCIALSPEQHVAAETIQNLNKQIRQLEQQRKQNLDKQKSIENQVQSLEREKQKARADIQAFDQKIGKTRKEMSQKETEIKNTEEDVKRLEAEIKEAQHQIELRNDLLKNRVRQIYESDSNLSYLDVLLGATSFSDLLVRMDFIQLLVNQDQKILEDFIAAKEVVEQNKIEVDKLMVQLQEQHKKLEALQAHLQDQRKQKSVRIASIDQQKEELAELDEQIQQDVLALVNEVAAKRSKVQEEVERQRARAQASSQPKAAATVSVTVAGGQYAWPVPASSRITSPFGSRIHPITGKRGGHMGLDIGASTPGVDGDAIVAAESGTVIIAEYLRGYGNTVVIDHGNGLRTLYAHIRDGGIKVNTGQAVKRGQKIAEMGNTGNSTATHLHFEVHKNGTQVNPAPYIQ